ncbi:MAG: geranylgeranylglycerol-phosphate geranylgeranyltransferase [Bacteroidota bacterium]
MSVQELFSLLRWKNLLMILATQFLVKYLVLNNTIIAQLYCDNHHLSFICISFATVIIAAAAYLFNNIVDIQSDRINQKNTAIHPFLNQPKKAMIAYYILNIMALMLAFYGCYRLETLYKLALFPIAILLLYIYNKNFKSTVLLGNSIVSMLTMISIIMVPYFEKDFYSFGQNIYYALIFMYGVFAFLVSMMREIIKDIEDMEGDHQSGITTLPTQLGILISKKITISIGLITLFLLLVFLHPFILSIPYNNYIIATQISLLSTGLFSIYKIVHAEEKEDFTQCSAFIKYWMIIGICSMCFIPNFIS